ncbi:extracellular solute-binding protein [Paenibacillus sp. RC67]|uniref:ABC transporter substrate-binding protein n=1 Tax=Paenibacillus sp. RC67 TaxID=3039392 RepID=UPI0024ACDB7E|nr:extracellular solute-binding protein [Paenibacillus sp. RC67]
MIDIKKKPATSTMLVLLSSLVFVGCTNSSGETPSANDIKVKDDETPVTLKIMQTSSVSISDDAFQTIFVDPVKAKYPYITLELVRNGQGTRLEDLVTAGTIPDMLMIWNGQMATYSDLNLFQDITPLIKKRNVDLNRFEPVVLDAIRVVSDKGELYGLPYAVQLNALYYNKDIFDKFGVPYPKDGMTWDDTIDLAKKVTRLDGDVQYRGLDPEHLERLSFQKSLDMVDAKTNKASVNTDAWKQVMENAYKIYSIPGNAKDSNNFLKQKTIAMFAGINIFDALTTATTKDGFTNWDVAQYPSYKDNPNVYGMVDTHVLTISKSTKYADAAMKVLEVVTSDEVQTISAKKTLRLTPLKNPEIKKALGADNPIMKDKHIDSIFKSKPAPAPVISPNHAKAKAILYKSFDEYLAGKDVNTALREAEANINQALLQP